jgi:hypothetical protein
MNMLKTSTHQGDVVERKRALLENALDFHDNTRGGPYLVQPWLVIGDTIFALSVIEGIWRHRAEAMIDVLCTDIQRQLFTDHPRVAEISLAELSAPSSPHSGIGIIPIPKDFYTGESEEVKQRLRDYSIRLSSRKYETVFTEDKENFKVLFGGRCQRYTHYSLRIFALQAIIEKLFPCIRGKLKEKPKYVITKGIINHYFGVHPSLQEDQDEPVGLYVASWRIAKAERRSASLKDAAKTPGGILLLVNADTSSPVTRPPTELLLWGIRRALEDDPRILVGILPGYTCPQAHTSLYEQLAGTFGRRVQKVVPDAQPEHLLDTVALIDQADIFVTGDTGLMHLAATKRITREGEEHGPHARNNLSIISLWGGTRPGYWGYPFTTIIGEGNPLQRQMYPGIRKYLWLQKKADYFGHIHPDQLTSAILTSASSFPGSEMERQPISET